MGKAPKRGKCDYCGERFDALHTVEMPVRRQACDAHFEQMIREMKDAAIAAMPKPKRVIRPGVRG